MRKPGVVILIMLFALAFSGVAYGGWSCIVKMNTDIKTGEFCVGVRGLNVNDTGSDPLWCSGPNQDDDDLGGISCEDGPFLCELDGEDYAESVDIFIRGYHSYAPGCTFEIANGGTIPAKIKGVLFSWKGDLARCIQVGEWSVDYHDGNRLSGSGRAGLVKAIDNTPLDPGQRMWVDIEFQVNQGAPEENQIASALRNALSVVATRAAEASEGDSSAPSDATTTSDDAGAGDTSAAPDAPASAPGTSSDDVDAGNAGTGDAAGDTPADTPGASSGDVGAGDTESGDAAGDAPAGTDPTSFPGGADAGGTETEAPSGGQTPASPEGGPPPDENPTGGTASEPGTQNEEPEVITGHAYGTLTIIYVRWNECDINPLK